MFDKPWTSNDLNRTRDLSAIERVARSDFDAAEEAFNAAEGDFAARLLAAVTAGVEASAEYETEPHVRIPADYQKLTVPELDAMIRPFAVGFLRSHPLRDELLYQVQEVKRRQESHAQWAPYEYVDPATRTDTRQ